MIARITRRPLPAGMWIDVPDRVSARRLLVMDWAQRPVVVDLATRDAVAIHPSETIVCRVAADGSYGPIARVHTRRA